MSDTPYVTAGAIFAVTEALLARLEGHNEVEQIASFGPSEPPITFTLNLGTGTQLHETSRKFIRHVRSKAEAMAAKLDVARTETRSDGLGRVIELTGIPAGVAWPVLTITVG